MRVNARFDGVAEKQVEYLATTLDTSVSEVLRESVDFYYRHTRAQGKPMKNLSALFGKGDSGLTDISTNVKKYVTMALNEKYPPRPAGTSGKLPSKRTGTDG
jgi:hypothetical protein